MFDRYSNSFLKIYFDIPAGREDEIARKVLIKHLQSGNSYGIVLKQQHTKFPQPELGSWVEGSATVGTDWHPPVLEGWEAPAGHYGRPAATMAVTLTQLAAFLTVVRRGSVTAAAEELFVTQPSVSAAVAALEREVGAKLLERDGRGLRPTGAGAAFAPYAAHVLGLLEEGGARRARRPRAAARRCASARSPRRATTSCRR